MEFRIEDTNLYKFLKDEIDMIIECYDEEKGYNKLTEADIKEIIEDLINNDYLSQSINDIITETMEEKVWEKYEKEMEE